MIQYIQNEQHYKDVLSKAASVKESLWIGTADIKDLYFDEKPFLEVISGLLKRGVEVRPTSARPTSPAPVSG